jgi:hypothetical protein
MLWRLQVDPVKRFDTYQVLEHPWISGKAKLPTINLSKSVSMNLKKSGLGQSKMAVDPSGASAEMEEAASAMAALSAAGVVDSATASRCGRAPQGSGSGGGSCDRLLCGWAPAFSASRGAASARTGRAAVVDNLSKVSHFVPCPPAWADTALNRVGFDVGPRRPEDSGLTQSSWSASSRLGPMGPACIASLPPNRTEMTGSVPLLLLPAVVVCWSVCDLYRVSVLSKECLGRARDVVHDPLL